MSRSARKSVASVGVRSTDATPIRPLSTICPGARVQLLERANYGGTMRPSWLEAGTALLVTAHAGDPCEAVLCRTTTPGASGPYYLSPSTSVRVLSERHARQNVAPESETDPLRKAAS